MARIKGLAPFSANFEPQMATPLDARLLVQYKADLILAATWRANDNVIYTYKGMLVVVKDDTEENNGIYVLGNTDYTVESNWVKYSSSSSSKFKRIDIDSMPMRLFYAGIITMELPFLNKMQNKYMPYMHDYYNLFLFEFYQPTLGVIGTDIMFDNDTEVLAWINANIEMNIDLIVRCYYYEDTSINSITPLKGLNHGYSILKGGNYFSGSTKTLADAMGLTGNPHNVMKWPLAANFIGDLFMYAFGKTLVGTDDAAHCIHFARNQSKIYVHHRDDYDEIFNPSMPPKNQVKYLCNDDCDDFIVYNQSPLRIVGSFYVEFTSLSKPSTYIMGKPLNNQRKYDMINDSESIIKVYKLKDDITGYNALLIKPVGVDKFYVSGVSEITPVTVVGRGFGAKNKQPMYKQISFDPITDAASNIVMVAYKRGAFMRLYGRDQILDGSGNKHQINSVDLMLGYGSGYFSARSNPIDMIINARGVQIQLQV